MLLGVASALSSVSKVIYGLLLVVVGALYWPTAGAVRSPSVCNERQRERFTCECRELSHGRISVDCSSNGFVQLPGHAIPRHTTELFLQHNRIQELRTNDFISLVNLLTLNLAYNELEDIQPNAFRGLASLTNLTLTNNYLSRIESNTFSDLVNLTHIDLRNNGIYWIASDAFYFSQNLHTLHLRGMKLQCDCETKLLRDWALTTDIDLTGVKCSNFIKDRDLIDVPDDQFGDCSDSPPQSCTLCTEASSLGECTRAGVHTECQESNSCQVTSYIISGQQVVQSRCQKASECVKELSLNPLKCLNDSPNQQCTFCCTGPNCNIFINMQGYTYQTSVAVGFTLDKTFDDRLLQTNSKTYDDLAAEVTRQLDRVLSSVKDTSLQVMHFRPSSANETTVTLHTKSVWSLERSASYVQENIYRVINKAIKDNILDLSIADGSLMVYVLGYCKAERTVSEEGHFQWPDAALGEQVTFSCPHPRFLNGRATRSCTSVWHEEDLVQLVTWDDPDLTECAIATNVTDQLQTLVRTPVNTETIKSVIRQLTELTSHEMSTTDIQYTSLTLENVINSDVKVDDNTSLGILATYNNLMTSNVDVLQRSQRDFHSIERSLKILDNFSKMLLSISDKTLTENQISVGIISPTKTDYSDWTFHVSRKDSMFFLPGQTSLMVNRTACDDSDTEAAITIPGAVLNTFTNNDYPLQFVAFKDDVLFRAMTSTDGKESIPSVNSLVMAASFAELHLENLSQPLQIKYRHKNKEATSPRCAFWDFQKRSWSSRGCHVLSHVTDRYTVCECNHMTNFALLMDIYGQGSNMGEDHKKALSIISYIGCSVSLAALLLTLIAYSISSKLRKDNPSKLLINLCVALSMVMILFVVVTQPLVWNNALVCKAMAGLLHYFLLSTWMWMAVEAFYMYLALIKIFQTYISRFILKCCLFGWGVPAVIVIITVSVSTDNYGKQGDICWLARMPFYGACLAPIAAILAANFVVFSLVIHQLRRLSARNDERSVKHYDIQTQLRGAVAVVVLLGLTWVFAIFAVDGGASLVFQYLFCVFNSLQGLFIFAFYCVLKKDVKDIWRQKWTDFTTTATSTGDRTNTKSDKFSSSRSGSIQRSAAAARGPRGTTLLPETTDRSTLTANSEHSEKEHFTEDSLMNHSDA